MPFSQKSLDFLFENRLMNSREWFHAHKADFDALLLQPMKELVVALTPTVSAVDPEIVTEPRTDRTISRIYRDMRYARDVFYREEMWISMKRDKKQYPCYPEFFFALWPGGWSYGTGWYGAPPDAQEAVRKMILRRDRLFLAALDALEGQSAFCLEGKPLKRTKYPGQPENIRQWLDRKSVCFVAETDDVSGLFADDLPQTIAAQFEAMAPLYRFLLAAEAERKTAEDRAAMGFVRERE